MVTVFRSADASAADDAAAARDLLSERAIVAELLGDEAPGVPVGAFEVRVAAADASRAEAILAENPNETAAPVDESHDLDLETAFGATSEMEAMSVQGLLVSNGISAVTVGDAVLPNLPFEIRVPKEQLGKARQIIAEAQTAGPAAAEEASQS